MKCLNLISCHVILTAAGEFADEALLLDKGLQPVLQAGSLDFAFALLQRVLQALDGAPDASNLPIRPAWDTILPAGSLQLVQGDTKSAGSCILTKTKGRA